MKKSKVKSIKPVKAFAIVDKNNGAFIAAFTTKEAAKGTLEDTAFAKFTCIVIPVIISPLKARKERKR